MPDFNPVVANSRFGQIYQRDIRAADDSTKMLQLIGRDWQHPLGTSHEALTEADWVLLTREAEHYGVPANLAAANAVLAEASPADLARRMRVKTSRLLEAVAEMRAVQQTAWAVAASSAPGEAAVQAATRDALETVKANFVVVPAKAFIDGAVGARASHATAQPRYAPGAAVEPRSIRLKSSVCCRGTSTFSMMASSRFTARTPISRIGCLTVVNGGLR